MDMDDPWGSPWAEEEVQTHHNLKSEKSDLEGRPTTPVRASTLVLEPKTNSPWDDAEDEGFGNWAAIPAEAEGDIQLGLDGTEEDWQHKTTTSVQLKEDLRSDTPWSEASTTTTTTTTTKNIPELSPSLPPELSELPRQSSPDPWAIHFHDDSETNPVAGAEFDKEIQHEPSDSNGVSELAMQSFGKELLSSGSTTPRKISTATNMNTSPEVEEVLETSEAAADMVVSPELEGVLEASEVATMPENPLEIPEAEFVSSRPSSSPSDHSHHDENFPESPRTSIDEDPKRPYTQRKVSSKVQELVEHFDGLAKPAPVPEPLQGMRQDSQEPSDIAPMDNEKDRNGSEPGSNESEQEDDVDDFGDFEEGNSDTEDSTLHAPSSAETHVSETYDRITVQKRTAEPRKDLGLVIFNIDQSILSTIYASIGVEPSTESIFIPDRDLDNTLATTEQRKTWYRISRYGTRRKHDAGDDENYARVTWTQSESRRDTLKIVARWMEEDRASGRVVLGGVSKGSSVFGWSDSKAAPVPIANAFPSKTGKKPEPDSTTPLPEIPREWPKGLVRDRSNSKGNSPSKARRRSSVKSQSISGNFPESKNPVASFSWNEPPVPGQSIVQNIGQSPSLAGKMESPPRKSRSVHRYTSSVPSATDIPSQKRPLVVDQAVHRASISKIVRPTLPGLAVANVKTQDDDDDDWGELVASPVVAVAPVFSDARKSQDSGRIHQNDSPSSIKPAEKWKPEIFSSATSVHDGILTPETTHSPIFPLQTHNQKELKPETAQVFPQLPITPAATPVIASAASDSDPWAVADFSFFESPVQSSMPTQKVASKVVPPKSVKFSNSPPRQAKKISSKSKEEIEQDAIVQSVVKGLPDLSYMLKR
jgi:hypothetical protein